MGHLRRRATACVIRRGKVLLVRDKGKHHFSLPGGGVHHGEPSLSAAARELYAETRLRATKVVRLFNYRGKVNEHRVFLVEADGHVHLGKELSDFMWWDGKTAILIYPHVTNILSQVVELLKGE
jgi:8-oxo-dGTP diphosphatase